MAFTINRIRDDISDTAAQNTFLQKEEFSDSEIEQAMDQALMAWNTMPPIISTLEYTTAADVPNNYTASFRGGAISYLLSNKQLLLHRNRQPVSVEGVGMDINSRVQAYSALSQQYMQLFMQWISTTKREKSAITVILTSSSDDPTVINIVQSSAQTKEIDLSGISDIDTYTVYLRAKENLEKSTLIYDKEITGTAGIYSIDIASTDFDKSGIVYGELTLVKDDKVHYNLPIFFNVENSLYASTDNKLTISRLRQEIKDREGDNFLLESIEFTDADLAEAIISPVDYWNSAPPELSSANYTPTSFPNKYYRVWRDAAVGYLYRTAANKLMRNSILPVNGVNTNAHERASQYLQISEQRIKEYQKWTQNTKYSLNVRSAWSGRPIVDF